MGRRQEEGCDPRGEDDGGGGGDAQAGPTPGAVASAGSSNRSAYCFVSTASPKSAPAAIHFRLSTKAMAPRAIPRLTTSWGWYSWTTALLAAGRNARKARRPASRAADAAPAAHNSARLPTARTSQPATPRIP